MNRKQSKTSGKPERPEHSGKSTPKLPRHGNGAASALATMKERERDRVEITPADDRPRRWGDGVHFDDAGHSAIAAAVEAVIDSGECVRAAP